MFFYLSKFSYFFISPANWVLVLLVWRLLSKSASIKKWLNIVLLVLLFVFGNEVIFNKLAIAWQTAPVQLPAGFKADAGIVLGGMVSFDANKNGFINSAADRLLETYVLYNTGVIKRIIIAGGSVKKNMPPESPFLLAKLKEMGVSKRDVIIESRSRTTFENALFSKSIIDSLHISSPLVLITSAMHMPRARQTFENAGIHVVPFPCNYVVLKKKYEWSDYVVPSLATIVSWNMLTKEIVGTLAYRFFDKA